jgi:hypothetical protein
MISTENADAGSPHADPQPVPIAPEPRKRRSGNLIEWLWRARALTDARSAVGRTPPLVAERLGRARRALELGDRAFDPIDPLRAGPSIGLALSLYREAAYWALLAQNEALSAPNLQEAFAKADAGLLLLVANGEEGLAAVRTALVDKDFVATAGDTPAEQRRDAAVAKEFVHTLVRLRLEPEARVGRLLVQRWARTVLFCLAVVAVSLGGWLVTREFSKGPDLAAGKPWRASSEYPGCNLREHRCNSTAVKIFFHTEEEDEPWVQFDLGAGARFAHVELTNRSDFGSDRAFPVVIESSDDAKKWKKLARRDSPYSTWRADFSPVTARFVRARVLKRTWFHLERFSVFAR